jgi:anti-sigma-K factor RskA
MEHPEDLLAAYALDALTAEERASVAAHLATCESCSRSVAEYRRVVAVLPLGMLEEAAPPPDLRDRIVAAAGREPRAVSSADGRAQQAQTAAARPEVIPDVQPARRALRWTGWLVAAALAVCTLAFGAWNVALLAQVQSLQRAPALSASLTATTDAPGGATGSVTIPPDGKALAVVANLPPPSSGTVYEAWVIDKQGPRAAGTFITTPDGHADIVLTQAARAGDVIAITAEPAPGTLAPVGKVLLKGAAQG